MPPETCWATCATPEPARKRHLLRLWIYADPDFADDGNIVRAVPTVAGNTSVESLLRE